MDAKLWEDDYTSVTRSCDRSGLTLMVGPTQSRVHRELSGLDPDTRLSARGLSRVARRGWDRVRRWALLSPDAYSARPWYYVHCATVLMAVGLCLLGIGGPRLLQLCHASSLASTLAVASPLLLMSGTALYLTEMLCSVLYDRPIRCVHLGRRAVVQHPVVVFFCALLVHLGTGASHVALLAVRAPQSSITLRIVAMVAVLLCALPAWIMMTHPGALYHISQDQKHPRRPMRYRSMTDTRGSGDR